MFQPWTLGERWFSDAAAVRRHLISVKNVKPALWSGVCHFLAPPPPPLPRMWARGFVILTIGTTCVQHHPKALCTALQTATNEVRVDTSTCKEPLAMDYVTSDVGVDPPDCERRRVWSIQDDPPLPSLLLVASASLSGTRWYLFPTYAAIDSLFSVKRPRLHSHFNQHKGRSVLWQPCEYQQLLCHACTRTIQMANADSNSGRWAELWGGQIRHLPFWRNPLLWMIRAYSHVHN